MSEVPPSFIDQAFEAIKSWWHVGAAVAGGFALMERVYRFLTVQNRQEKTLKQQSDILKVLTENDIKKTVILENMAKTAEHQREKLDKMMAEKGVKDLIYAETSSIKGQVKEMSRNLHTLVERSLK